MRKIVNVNVESKQNYSNQPTRHRYCNYLQYIYTNVHVVDKKIDTKQNTK